MTTAIDVAPPLPSRETSSTPLWRDPVTWMVVAGLVMAIVVARFVRHRLRGKGGGPS